MTDSKHDYYELLGIPQNASADEIRKAYRKVAIQYHPDKNPSDHNAEEKFKESAEAYKVLFNTKSRRAYDQYGHKMFTRDSVGHGGVDFKEALRIFTTTESQTKPHAHSPSKIVLPLIAVIVIVAAGGLLGGGAVWWKHKEPEEPRRKVIGYRIVGTQQIPIYQDEEASSHRNPSEINAQRFDITTQEIRIALASFAEGNRAEALNKLDTRHDKLVEWDDPDQHLVRLAQVIAELLDGETMRADSLLQEIPTPDAEGRTDLLIAYMAEYLRGNHTVAKFRENTVLTSPDSPVLADLLEALLALRTQQLTAAIPLLETYAEADHPANATWGLQFGEPAASLANEIRAWNTLTASFGAMTPHAAIELLRSLRTSSSPYLHPFVDTELTKAEDRLQEQQAAMEAEAATAQQAAEQTDKEAVAQAIISGHQQLLQRKYSGMVSVIDAIEPSVKTENGKTLVMEQRQRIAALVNMQSFLVRTVHKNPPTQALRGFSGKRISRADAEGIYFASVDGGGSAAWSSLSPKLYLKIFDYCIANASADVTVKGKHLLAMAVYCYENKALRTADRYRNLALQAYPSLAEPASRWMPELTRSREK